MWKWQKRWAKKCLCSINPRCMKSKEMGSGRRSQSRVSSSQFTLSLLPNNFKSQVLLPRIFYYTPALSSIKKKRIRQPFGPLPCNIAIIYVMYLYEWRIVWYAYPPLYHWHCNLRIWDNFYFLSNENVPHSQFNNRTGKTSTEYLIKRRSPISNQRLHIITYILYLLND